MQINNLEAKLTNPIFPDDRSLSLFSSYYIDQIIVFKHKHEVIKVVYKIGYLGFVDP